MQMAFHNWKTKNERIQKSAYIYQCRKIIKAMVKEEWLEAPTTGRSWDHRFSCQIAHLSHLPLYITNCVPNLELLDYKQNNRKGTRCSVGIDVLINEFNNWPDKNEYIMWIKEKEKKWNIDFNDLISYVDVNKPTII
jgi:hypothetical protein